jgi:FdhD protein
MNLQGIQIHNHTEPAEGAITRYHKVITVTGNTVEETTVQVCIEGTVTVTLNGRPIASVKVTPTDLDSFAIGFLICEGLVSDLSVITAVKIYPSLIATTVDTSACIEHELSLEVRSAGIGIRHTHEISGLPIGRGIMVDKPVLFEGAKKVHEIASIWRTTGGTHCTILLDPKGTLVAAAEDIGRHSSIDKAIGKALLSGRNPKDCFMVCTGRLPEDMVAKAYRAGISVVVSNNAPFSSGIALAERMNITLVGFARPPRMNIYAHPERINLQ